VTHSDSVLWVALLSDVAVAVAVVVAEMMTTTVPCETAPTEGQVEEWNCCCCCC